MLNRYSIASQSILSQHGYMLIHFLHIPKEDTEKANYPESCYDILMFLVHLLCVFCTIICNTYLYSLWGFFPLFGFVLLFNNPDKCSSNQFITELDTFESCIIPAISVTCWLEQCHWKKLFLKYFIILKE